MAKIFKLPEGLEAPRFDFRQGYPEYQKAENAFFIKVTETLKARNPKDEYAGTLIFLPYADGKACYAVLSSKPLHLAHVPFGDAYRVPDAHERGLTLKDAEIAFQKLWSK